ncbi:AraC family transcriptional regulator [Promicromonospora thailandica]|uniref:AraC-type DNA-binding protein n=1 Tax=Promicromonospora thailandica TaxID=765201 RepID=A0A9X2JYQ4_9MICO|nr:AraC family transcriptional regulator [Promicromonospora thailandica]MCP2265294.1 AraC-type DNA-binding protein [Promicromonospora thailandica]BFF16819.1 AraC family transcriptional regulator [Promicromonospora thailandica]
MSAVDPLSEILTLAGARCVISGELRAGGRWSVRFRTDAVVKLDAVARGACWLIADDGEPLRLTAGDAVVLNGARTMVLCSDPALRPVDATGRAPEAAGETTRYGDGEDVVVVGGHVDLDPVAGSLFTTALPPVLRAGAGTAEAAEMRRSLDRITREAGADRPGAAFATDQHAQLLLLEALRVGLGQEELGRAALRRPGWLRLLADPRLRPAVRLLHGDPARAWSLAGLASAAGMSRSHFAQRFREVSGVPPLTYLSHWRVLLAERALRDTDVTVAALGARLGYASESSFSHAFTRVTGTPPSRYRRAAAQRSREPGAGSSRTVEPDRATSVLTVAATPANRGC